MSSIHEGVTMHDAKKIHLAQNLMMICVGNDWYIAENKREFAHSVSGFSIVTNVPVHCGDLDEHLAAVMSNVEEVTRVAVFCPGNVFRFLARVKLPSSATLSAFRRLSGPPVEEIAIKISDETVGIGLVGNLVEAVPSNMRSMETFEERLIKHSKDRRTGFNLTIEESAVT